MLIRITSKAKKMDQILQNIIREGKSVDATHEQEQEYLSLFHNPELEFDLKTQLLGELHQTENEGNNKLYFDNLFEKIWHNRRIDISGGNPATKVFSFKLPTNSGVGIAENATEVNYKALRLGNDIIIKASNLPSNNELNVDLFDISGKLITGKKITPASNAFETSIQGANLAKGTYLIRIGTENTSFQKVTKLVIE